MRKRRFPLLAALAMLLLVGPTAATASAQVPDDDPDVAAPAVAVPTNPGTEIQSVEYELPWADGERACAGIQRSRDSEVDSVLFYCDDSGKGWYYWDINFLYRNAAGTPIYEIKNPYTGLCLSVEGVESGAAVNPDNGHDAQQEPCERQHDARWWFSSDGHGHVLVRLYLKNSAGRYPCLEADNSDVAGDVQVQIWDCPSSEAREWILDPNNT